MNHDMKLVLVGAGVVFLVTQIGLGYSIILGVIAYFGWNYLESKDTRRSNEKVDTYEAKGCTIHHIKVEHEHHTLKPRQLRNINNQKLLK